MSKRKKPILDERKAYRLSREFREKLLRQELSFLTKEEQDALIYSHEFVELKPEVIEKLRTPCYEYIRLDRLLRSAQ
ncbi:MAG: hypothetical protein LIP03_03325 [Bacteroidales bacterium]|nr:hypothetical protein [Bacteroidales bacterium]